MKETDLYPPVKELLQSLGYQVRAEVADMDVVGLRGEELIVVELKTSFTLKLLLQATMRQKLAQEVYVAIPAPTGRQRFSKAFKEYEHLLKRLELGLILVRFTPSSRAELLFPPAEHPRKTILARNKKKSHAARKEASQRVSDHNLGGTKGKLVTVYRERSLLVAHILMEDGPQRIRDLKERTGDDGLSTLLRGNPYGWFTKVERGIYAITPQGQQALLDYQEVVVLLKGRSLDPATP